MSQTLIQWTEPLSVRQFRRQLGESTAAATTSGAGVFLLGAVLVAVGLTMLWVVSMAGGWLEGVASLNWVGYLLAGVGGLVVVGQAVQMLLPLVRVTVWVCPGQLRVARGPFHRRTIAIENIEHCCIQPVEIGRSALNLLWIWESGGRQSFVGVGGQVSSDQLREVLEAQGARFGQGADPLYDRVREMVGSDAVDVDRPIAPPVESHPALAEPGALGGADPRPERPSVPVPGAAREAQPKQPGEGDGRADG